MDNMSVRSTVRVEGDEHIVYFSALDLSSWLRAQEHGDALRETMVRVADMIDSAALDAILSEGF